METRVTSSLQRPAAELTVTDVYDIAAGLGQEFERVIDRFGCESLVGVVPKVVRVLELLEALVSSAAAGHEAEELQTELDTLRQERSERFGQEKKHQRELELVEDVWRGEVQDLLSQINQLHAENKKLSVSLSLKDFPVTQEQLQQQEGMSEKDRQEMKKLKDSVNKQRDEIRARDHELTLKNEDVDALQMQQHRVIRINQDLRHRIGVMEAQGKSLIQQRAELEAAAQAGHQELVAAQREVARLRKKLQQRKMEKEVIDVEEVSSSQSGISPPASSLMTSSSSNCIKPNSVWVECGADPGFLANCFERDKSLSLLPRLSKRLDIEEEGDKDEDTKTSSLVWEETEPETETDSPEQDSNKPRFTLQELRDVLQEKNELKAQVFLLQEELTHYKSEEFEDDISFMVCPPSPPPISGSIDQAESGIRSLIFTAIMPMVAAGLIADDPTLLPIRRLFLV
ncbi:RILP-like protein 1 isoform 2-T2 [Spinachia spinachia]